MPCIEARGLRKAFGTTVAVDGIDLRVEEGRIVGLIGPNGAGKTSALRAILGLTHYEGHLTVLGREPFRETRTFPIVAIGQAKHIGQSLLSDGRIGSHGRHDWQSAVRINLLACQHHAAVHVADDRKHARIIAKRLGGGLSFLRVRLIVDHLRDDLRA